MQNKKTNVQCKNINNARYNKTKDTLESPVHNITTCCATQHTVTLHQYSHCNKVYVVC